MRFVPVLAVVVTAMALYVSGGILDQILTPDGLVRVALLPPWQALGGFAATGALGLLWLNRRTVPRGTATTTAMRPSLGPLLLPCFGLLLLVLPYLPVLPDVLPAVQLLAGPIRYVVWLVVGSQLIWSLWQARILRADALQRATLGQLAVAIGLATAVVSGLAAWRLTDTVIYPGGDEPHYLVIAQSLWRDGDLKIENNHTRGDYHEYFEQDLAPHYLTRGADREIYSIHPVGMPVLIAPIYAVGGYHAVVFAFVVMASLAAALMWHTVVRVTNAAGAATFAWAAVVATAPFLYNSFAVYPEIPAAVAVAIAFTLIAVSDSPRRRRWWVVGIACALLPWFSTKYAPMSAALVAIALARIVYPASAPVSGFGAPQLQRGAAVLVPYVVSLAGWFYFFYAIWGIPLPQAPYGALVQTDLRYLIFGGPGLLFDQEYGLLPYAPVYILAATGLWAMVRADAESRRRAVELVLVVAALVATVGAFRIWWGGSASPGRPVTSGLLLLAIPIAFAFRTAPAASAARAAQHLLLSASVGIAGILLFAQEGLLLASGRDGTSTLLEYLSPRWPAWMIAPSFIYHEAPNALLHTAIWLMLATVAAVAIRAARTTRPGAASLVAVATTALALLIAAEVMPRLPLNPPWPTLDVRARARLPLLDGFDDVARPTAIEYTPMRLTSPEALITHASVIVEPELRRQSQPIRVLHNGRFSLPAGSYRIEIDWTGARNGEVLGLQIGRTGTPLTKWTVDPRPGERWTAEFAIPVDAGFVGLRGSAELERVIGQVRFVPISIVNAGQRLRSPAVIAAARSGPASIFFYDTFASPETNGFWVWGARTTRVTISRPNTEGPLLLRVHSGPIPNQLKVSTFGWSQSVDLPPDSPVDIEVPAQGNVLTFAFAAAAEFVPREIDPATTDARPLGVWVEVTK